MGEAQHSLFSLEFNSSVTVEARPERLTGDAGALLLREVLSRLRLDEVFEQRLVDRRDPALVRHPLIELLRTHVLLLAQGWQDQDDADELRQDPALRLAVSERRGVASLQESRRLEPTGLASQPTLSRFQAAVSDQREVLREGLFQTAARRVRAARGRKLFHATLDVDSLPLEVHGHQEGSAFNGHYGARIFHPLVALVAETGDLLDVRLREGNAHTAEGATDFIVPLLEKMERDYCRHASVRMDAGFPSEPLLAALERRGTHYVCRLRTNARLESLAAPYLSRPPGRPPHEPREWLYELDYQAASWSRSRRVVLVVQERPGELFLHHFFLLTSWSIPQRLANDLLALYRRRGTAEAHLGELVNVIAPSLSSARRTKSHYRGKTPQTRTLGCDPFAANETKLLLSALAYQILHALRIFVEQTSRQGWSLRRLLDRVLRVPARILLHARHALVVLNPHSASHWQRIWRHLRGFHWVPPPCVES